MRLNLEPFGVDCLEHEARRQHVTLGVLLRHAALYYLGERSSGRLAVRVPWFARDEDGARPIAVAVDLDRSDWQRFEDAAALERVSVPALLQHAAMLYVADADSGRLGARLLGLQPS